MKELMEKSSGTVIQTYAKVLRTILDFIVAIVGVAIVYIGVFAIIKESYRFGALMIAIGVLVIVIGFLINLILLSFVKGYGEIIEDLRQIRVYTENQSEYFEWLNSRMNNK